jgi:malate dehydrogenase (oxaloacetate-decarboxylating)(NADP+)
MATTSKTSPKLNLPKGAALLHEPLFNKGSAFTEAERLALGIKGLLPPYVQTMEEQVSRVMENYRAKQTDLERYIHLITSRTATRRSSTRS